MTSVHLFDRRSARAAVHLLESGSVLCGQKLGREQFLPQTSEQAADVTCAGCARVMLARFIAGLSVSRPNELSELWVEVLRFLQRPRHPWDRWRLQKAMRGKG